MTTSEGRDDALQAAGTVRGRLQEFIESDAVTRFIIIVIMINAIVIGLETSSGMMDAAGPVLIAIDRIALSIFVIELLIKLIVYRLSFFRSGWNIFDFLIVAASLAPESTGITVLRALRILRAMRLISVVPQMRLVAEALLRAIPSMGSVVALLALVFYVGAVMATKLFGEDFDVWFGTVGRSAFSLFQIMTLESWSMGIVRPVMELYPYAWIFFIPFILIVTFAVLNLFIAIIVNSMQNASQSEAEEEAKQTSRELAMVTDELRALSQEVRSLREQLGSDADRTHRH